jgi:hypothetical protein
MAFIKIADLFSLDDDNDLPPIESFADILKSLLKGMTDESQEICLTVISTLENMFTFFKATMEPLLPKFLEKVI